MNRFFYADSNSLLNEEKFILSQANVRLYDGEEKTLFDSGDLILTSYRIFWKDLQRSSRDLALPLSFIVFLEEENGSWMKSAKIIAHVNSVPADDANDRPIRHSPKNFIKFSFRSGGQPQFFRALSEVLSKKAWENPAASLPQGKKYRAGISGIERQMKARNEITDENISLAFEDLSNLMKMAKDMVTISKSITQKLKDKQGSITEDETVQFKSHLLSLGISDPVTRSAYVSGSTYYIELSKQLAKILEKPLNDVGGILSLTDVYCRVNRARGMELISPEDLINACSLFEKLKLPIRLHTFDSGVRVLMLQSHDQDTKVIEAESLLKEKNSLTAEETSVLMETTVALAKEYLLAAEKVGLACRDDCVEGLRFYPNLFLTNET